MDELDLASYWKHMSRIVECLFLWLLRKKKKKKCGGNVNVRICQCWWFMVFCVFPAWTATGGGERNNTALIVCESTGGTFNRSGHTVITSTVIKAVVVILVFRVHSVHVFSCHLQQLCYSPYSSPFHMNVIIDQCLFSIHVCVTVMWGKSQELWGTCVYLKAAAVNSPGLNRMCLMPADLESVKILILIYEGMSNPLHQSGCRMTSHPLVSAIQLRKCSLP